MRGIATLAAAASAWLITGNHVPPVGRVHIRLPSLPGTIRAIASGLLAGLLVSALVGIPAAAGAIACLSAVGVLTSESDRADRVRRQVADQWPDFLAILRSRLASGAGLEEAFLAAGHHLGDEFEACSEEVEDALTSGRGLTEGLAAVRARLADPVADRILTTIDTAHRTGGGRVVEILGSLSASVADELRLRRAHDAALTEQRLTAAVALVAPWVLLLLTIATNPTAAAAYRTTAGTTVIAMGLLGTALGYFLAKRTSRLSRPPRLFS